MANLTFRNSQRELVDIPSFASTEVKNTFGTMLDRGAAGPVAIPRHDATRAVLPSFEEFQSLAQTRLRALDAEFDELLARIKTEKARKGMAAAFDATSAALGRAAVKAARPAGHGPADTKSPRPLRRVR